MPARIDFRRYRKVRRFVARTFLHALWWDLLLNAPGLRRLRRPARLRWQEVARRYRGLAGEMGGVLIKIGQFLSTRVDILPREVTRELAGLQDEAPPAPFADIVKQLEADFGRPVAQVFASLEPVPVGSASLAQVHRATLPSGETVVVKVLRPGIDVLVETDLAAARLALRLLKVSRHIRRRVDLARLGREITETTRAELDLVAEGHNAERFAADFERDRRVYIPKIHWPESGRRTLTMENVAYLKIADLAGIERAGVSRAEVAKVLYRTYMQQIFIHHFVHADPHPGNLFVRPLPVGDEAPFRPGDEVTAPAGGPARPFQIVFVDFGMVAVIPERLRHALREYAIGLGTRDAARIVHSYVAAGVLLPGADLRRLEEVHEELFARFWGVRIGSLREAALSEASFFLREYRDLLYEIPFQMQVDLVFTSRAVGLLAGMATHLNAEFDPWAETMPFAEQLAQEELAGAGLLKEAWVGVRAAIGLPQKVDAFLTRGERGQLTVQTSLTPEAKKTIQRLEGALHRLGWMITAAALLIAGVMLSPESATAGRWLMGGAGAAFLWGLVVRR
jgi:predicted unusual protein kinase regulating ubiquinone biosynthesis (AarF/ABC1/UbiB family)